MEWGGGDWMAQGDGQRIISNGRRPRWDTQNNSREPLLEPLTTVGYIFLTNVCIRREAFSQHRKPDLSENQGSSTPKGLSSTPKSVLLTGRFRRRYLKQYLGNTCQVRKSFSYDHYRLKGVEEVARIKGLKVGGKGRAQLLEAS